MNLNLNEFIDLRLFLKKNNNTKLLSGNMTSVMTMHIEFTASFTLEKIGNVYAVPTNIYIKKCHHLGTLKR